MSPRAATRLGWSVWGLCVALGTFTVVLSLLGIGERQAYGSRDTASVADAVGSGVYFFAVLAPRRWARC